MRKLTLIFLYTFIFLTGCSSLKKHNNFEQRHKSPLLNQDPIFVTTVKTKKIKEIKESSTKEVELLRKKLVNYAKEYNNQKKVPSPFRNDCSGFIRFVYNIIDVDPFKSSIVRKNGKWLSGTELVYNFSKENGSVFKDDKKLKLGDFIFFDNTHDKNKNKKLDDPFTHIAIVVEIETDGTIHYIHKSGRGINIQRMNIRDKHNRYTKRDGKNYRINSYLRVKGKNDPPKTPYLSAELFSGFGSIF